MMNHIKISKNFWLNELQCKGTECCGGLVKVDPELVGLLEKLRKEVGKPLTITSGYRCEKHNKEVGGMPNSYHLKGMAADITVTRFDIRELALLAKSAGIRTIILYPNRGFIHVDTREHPLGLVGVKMNGG